MIAAALLALLPVASGSDELELVPLASPAPPGARYPNLALGKDGDDVVLSWLEPTETTGKRFGIGWSRYHGKWSEASRGPEGEGWFVNWADFPLVAPGGNGLLFLWLQRLGEGPYAYGVRATTAHVSGLKPTEPFWLHDDTSAVEHGFVSAAPYRGDWLVAWLDGRETAEPGGAMTLRLRRVPERVRKEENPWEEGLLDERVCDCCQTDVLALPNGTVLVAYRDRGPEETRDISIVRVEKEPSQPIPVHEDGWKIAACPVNGPALASHDGTVAVAWYTEARRPEVRVAFSEDGARSFAPPVRVDDGHPLGRVDVAYLRDGSLLVSWLEQTTDGAEWRIRRLVDGKRTDDVLPVAAVPSSREIGFLRMVGDGTFSSALINVPGPGWTGALIAWTEKNDDGFVVKTARVKP